MGYKNYVASLPLASFNTAGLTVNFQAVNPGGLTAPCSLVQVTNASKTDIILSYDGINEHEYVAHGDVLSLPTQLTADAVTEVSAFRYGSIFYIKGVGPSIGYIYISSYYQAVKP